MLFNYTLPQKGMGLKERLQMVGGILLFLCISLALLCHPWATSNAQVNHKYGQKHAGNCKITYPYSARIDFSRQDLTSVDVRF